MPGASTAGYIEPVGMTITDEMKVAILLHAPTEPAGLIAGLLSARGHSAEAVRLDETNEVPDTLDEAALVLMGGPMSANDESASMACRGEGARPARRRGRATHPRRLPRCSSDRVGPRSPRLLLRAGGRLANLMGEPGNPIFPPSFPAFQMHGETFDLPAGAVLLATGGLVPHQAFGRRGRPSGSSSTSRPRPR